jgi:hypothetical protein
MGACRDKQQRHRIGQVASLHTFVKPAQHCRSPQTRDAMREETSRDTLPSQTLGYKG